MLVSPTWVFSQVVRIVLGRESQISGCHLALNALDKVFVDDLGQGSQAPACLGTCIELINPGVELRILQDPGMGTAPRSESK
jgi:hypothetical protein